MKVLMVLALVVLAAATAFAYGGEVTTMTAVVARTTALVISEPVAMLVSGGLLLVIAGAVRRLEV